MNLPSAVRQSSTRPLRSRSGRLVSVIGLVSLALFEGCGASGSGGDEPIVQDPNAGSAGAGGGGIYVPPPGGIVTDCSGTSCMLGGVEVTIPPGCGDGTRTDDEACDDGNRASGDGCDENCLLTEPGFSCANAGEP